MDGVEQLKRSLDQIFGVISIKGSQTGRSRPLSNWLFSLVCTLRLTRTATSNANAKQRPLLTPHRRRLRSALSPSRTFTHYQGLTLCNEAN